jgi:hypothetical protein
MGLVQERHSSVDALVDALQEAIEDCVGKTDVATLDLVVELLLLRHELIHVLLIEEQLERVEFLDEGRQRSL